jgi:hypothetical protein
MNFYETMCLIAVFFIILIFVGKEDMTRGPLNTLVCAEGEVEIFARLGDWVWTDGNWRDRNTGVRVVPHEKWLCRVINLGKDATP